MVITQWPACGLGLIPATAFPSFYCNASVPGNFEMCFHGLVCEHCA